ncbi:MAG: type II toxin-antitoxin system RelE/ParE family toxin [Bacteroidetes bacterium]|nr:type II toxin-antitoxin system RelE/ParE family toxin [Bacteroidota bacterium]
MREILITPECLEFIDNQNDRISDKFYQIIEVIGEVKIVHANFVKKLKTTDFYELRIKAGNEIRVIMFAVDHLNFAECTKVICLNGFQKKSAKDYIKAIKMADKILSNYL